MFAIVPLLSAMTLHCSVIRRPLNPDVSAINHSAGKPLWFAILAKDIHALPQRQSSMGSPLPKQQSDFARLQPIPVTAVSEHPEYQPLPPLYPHRTDSIAPVHSLWKRHTHSHAALQPMPLRV